MGDTSNYLPDVFDWMSNEAKTELSILPPQILFYLFRLLLPWLMVRHPPGIQAKTFEVIPDSPLYYPYLFNASEHALALPSKQIHNLATCHYFHCYYPNPNNHYLLPR